VRAVEVVIETHPRRIPHLRARNLRHDQTDAEAQLWARMRGGQLEGLKFRRQFQVGQFIADFCCPQRRLIIELDGGHHAEQLSADEWRSKLLGERGYRVLRFWNDEVLTNMDGVLEQIVAVLGERR
jgi:very-short-patch-repair endonuclease